MRNKLFKAFVSALLVACLLGISAVAALPEDGGIAQPYYTGISIFDLSFDINNGVAECESSINISSLSNTGKLWMRLQRSSDGENWSNYVSWSASGSVQISLDEDQSISHGFYYRVHCSANVYDSNGNLLGINTKTSGEIYY